jgi:zinc protease
MKWVKNAAVVISLVALVTACGAETTKNTKDHSNTIEQIETSTSPELVSFEKFTLDNGLKVVMHVDRSDPVVAVALTSHVGSAREKPGRTGFAHLFEHLLFLESENLGKGGLDKLSARIGGSGANGSTSRDRTNYFQTVPNDALEKMIWAEADKLGFFINTVTEPVLAKEKQVVKNEKRQGIDNRPYGHSFYIVDKNLYPEGHPYNWQVIGSLEDLQNATLDDVKEFFRRWYVPNNVTLTIAGDFDPKQAKVWVKKYFGEIKPGNDIARQEKQPITLNKTKKRFYEDNFARTPQLLLTWPGVYQYHADSYPLEVLISYLSEGKDAPLNKVLIDDKKLTTTVFMFNQNSELAGQTTLGVRALDGVSLDEVQAGIDEALSSFEETGISESDLARVKATTEVGFYSGIESVLGKAFQLAQYDIFAGDPGFINEDIKNIQTVTREDVMRVYETYIKGKNHIAVSTVPKGQVDLALSGSTQAQIVEEKIVQGAEESFDASIKADYERTPSSFDRSVEPEYGPEPILRIPTIWEDTFSNGLRVFGIEDTELPLVRFDLTIEGGQLQDNIDKVGVANLVGEMMMQGTLNRTTSELEQAIEALGANINVSTGSESIRITGNTLAKNLDATIAILEEIILEPRWDAEEFTLAKLRILNQLEQEKSNPNAIADTLYAKLSYGADHILAQNILGSSETVNAITLDDLKAYYTKNFAPNISRLHVVGAVKKAEILEKFANLNQLWKEKEVKITEIALPAPPTESKVYFYDIPNAKQSVIRFGYPALKQTDTDYYPATLMNYRLGGGGFASRLTQELREGKGYTYGIGSSFSGTAIQGDFTVSSSVRSNITLEASELIKEILMNYGSTFTEQDLTITKGFQLKSKARAFETLNAKLGLLRNISSYGLPYDYIVAQNMTIRNLTVADVQKLAEKHIKIDQMNYLIVGDAATQLERLSALGFGEPILLTNQ